MTNTIVHHFIRTTPPITKILVFLTILVSLSVTFDFVKPQSIGYSRYYLADLQLYRIFTSFFYYGKASFELIMNFIFLYRYSAMLEESYSKKSDYFYTLFLIFVSLIATSTIFYIPFLASPLSNTLTYIWSRKNPQGVVQIFGFVSFSAFFLPFVFPFLTLLFERRIAKDELIGILIGQIVFYFRDVYPKIGKDYFGTPCWVHLLFNEICDDCKIKKEKKASSKSNIIMHLKTEMKKSEIIDVFEDGKTEITEMKKSEIIDVFEDGKTEIKEFIEIKKLKETDVIDGLAEINKALEEGDVTNIPNELIKANSQKEDELCDEFTDLTDNLYESEDTEFDEVSDVDYEDVILVEHSSLMDDSDDFACVEIQDSMEEEFDALRDESSDLIGSHGIEDVNEFVGSHGIEDINEFVGSHGIEDVNEIIGSHGIEANDLGWELNQDNESRMGLPIQRYILDTNINEIDDSDWNRSFDNDNNPLENSDFVSYEDLDDELTNQKEDLNSQLTNQKEDLNTKLVNQKEDLNSQLTNQKEDLNSEFVIAKESKREEKLNSSMSSNEQLNSNKTEEKLNSSMSLKEQLNSTKTEECKEDDSWDSV